MLKIITHNLDLDPETIQTAEQQKQEIHSKHRNNLRPLGGEKAAAPPAILAATRKHRKPVPPQKILDNTPKTRHSKETVVRYQPEPQPDPEHYINHYTPQLEHPATQKELKEQLKTGHAQIINTYKKVIKQKTDTEKHPSNPEITKKTFDYYGDNVKELAHKINRKTDAPYTNNKTKAAATIYIASQVLQ